MDYFMKATRNSAEDAAYEIIKRIGMRQTRAGVGVSIDELITEWEMADIIVEAFCQGEE